MKTRSTCGLVASFYLAISGMLFGTAWGQGSAPPAPEQFKPIGKIITSAGTVNIEHTAAVLVQVSAPSGAKGNAKVGDLVYQGDVVQTGVDGAVGIV